MKNKDCFLNIEKLDSRKLLSSNPWYVDTVNADKVWTQLPTNISNKPVVAIIDSGVDLNHESLKDNIWTNPLEIANNNKDDDNNGYVDDVNGWDFVQNDNVPQDGFYHGTFVAGIVDSVANNQVDILPLRTHSDGGSAYVGSISAAINYTIALKNRGVNIAAVNCSFGGFDANQPALASAIQRASDSGILVIMAAGNNGANMDISPKYPGSLSYSNTLTVAAIDPSLSLANYSNYGKNTVSVAAPGSNIFSILPGNAYGTISGTSFSAPIVSAEAGLLKTLGNYSATQIKNAILKGSDLLDSLADKVGCGLVNIAKAWGLLKSQSVDNSTVVNPVPASVVVLPKAIVYKIDGVSSSVISGWTYIKNDSVGVKPVVEVYINNVLRYKTTASLYRGDTKVSNGFYISMNKKLFNKKLNLVEIRIKDSCNQLEIIAYKGYIKK